MERLPGEIEALEDEHRRLTVELADPNTYKDGGELPAALRGRLTEVEKAQEEKFIRWEALEQKRAAMEGDGGAS